MPASSSASSDRFPLTTGADIVVEQLVRHGVDIMFAYPGAATIPLHQSLIRRRDAIRVILPRHEQGGAFAAQGYARSTGKVGVVMATSGPGAANLLTGVADAQMDSVPLLVITGQVVSNAIGTDAFQELPTTEVFKSITKQHYLVTDVHDTSRIMNEAFHIAQTGRKGPVLVDFPKDVLTASCPADYDAPMNLPGYSRIAKPLDASQTSVIADLLLNSRRPVILAGGGVIASEASEELLRLAEWLNIPVTTTLMGIGAFPSRNRLSLDHLGMHGSVYANIAVSECDVLLVLGSRLSDRATGKVSEFASKASVIHVDIDSSELRKVIPAEQCVTSDVKQFLIYLLDELSRKVEQSGGGSVDNSERQAWFEKINALRLADPFDFDHSSQYILPQQAIQELCRLSEPYDPIVTTGVGQHQMWTAQFFKTKYPRQLLTSGGAGTMGFGLPAAMGAKAANPDKMVICIDGDGSALMNNQEMATCYCERLPVKAMVLNNQHLGMVVQMEDKFFQGNRAHTYLGPVENPEALGRGVGIGPERRYPNFVKMAESFGWTGRHIINKADLVPAIEEMLTAKGSFLLDVAVPYQEYVMPMIPAGCGVKDIMRR